MGKMLCRCCRYAIFATLGVVFACFLRPRAEAATVERCPAFAVAHTRVSLKTKELQPMLMASTDDEIDGTSRARVETTRRECIERSLLQAARVMGIATTAPWNKISVAEAATVSTTEPKQQAAVLQSWLCDPTVYGWKKQGRTVHIVGTSHFSSVSADLAGNVVREVQPDCLFIELDLKRIGRAFRGGRPIPGLKLAFWDTQGNLRVGTTVSVPPDPISWLGQGISQLVQREGFLAGEEMINSVQEAFNIGAVVVLGDRDFGISMRRLAEASKNTDIRKLIEPNRVMTEMMKEELPETREWGKFRRPSKEEMRGFIETLKTKEMADRLMNTWKSFAPEAYTVMIKERDEYMSIGLDKLSPFQTVVAVMGLAHVDGVTRNLEAMGWHRIRQPKC